MLLREASETSFFMRMAGQSAPTGLSRLERYIANVRALAGLYRRIGAFPAKRLRQEKHVGTRQLREPQPYRSWCTNLAEVLTGQD